MSAPPDSGEMLSIQDPRSMTGSNQIRGVLMLPSEAAKEQSIAASVPEVQPKNADPMSTILEYIDSSDRSVLEERSEIMDAIEFSKGYPTKDRMKLGVCCLEVGLNLLSEELGVELFGDDYRKDVNDALKTILDILCAR